MGFLIVSGLLLRLQEVKHPNIIELVDVFGHVSSVSIVMDFMDTDLEVRA